MADLELTNVVGNNVCAAEVDDVLRRLAAACAPRSNATADVEPSNVVGNETNAVADEVDDVLQKLTPDEKVSLLSGAGMWESGGVQRHGIEPLRMTDGPHGARGMCTDGLPGSRLVPCSLALGATFDDELVEQVGELLGRECARVGADMLLGPCLNLQRYPWSGRHFECFSEDPHLTARMGVAYIRGVQRHVLACPKHFACNDQETDRGTMNSVVDERTLREVYLAPFEAAVVEGGAMGMMCGYNRLNGSFCTESDLLLQRLLRDEWHFEGLVMSDWWGNKSQAASLSAGLNLEMPGIEPRHFGGYLREAVDAGRISTHLLDERCRQVLHTLSRRRKHSRLEINVRSLEDEALLERAAAQSFVLLRNKGDVLPLNAAKLKKLAVIGPNAAHTVLQGGGSSRVRPQRSPSILEALRAEFEGSGMELVHEVGAQWEYLPKSMHSLEVGGLMAMGRCDEQGQPLAKRFNLLPSASAFNDWFLNLSSWFSRKDWFRHWCLPVLACFGLRQSTPTEAAKKAKAAGRPPPRGLTDRGLPVAGDEELLKAAELVSADCDATVLVVGTHGWWELEGVDQPHMRLLGHQDTLIERVAAAAKGPVVVVMNVGSPKTMPWLDKVSAVIVVHFGGERIAPAVVSTIFGSTSPGGRLPTSWPRDEADVPAKAAALLKGVDWVPGDEIYAEELFVGYRGYSAPFSTGKPLFPFGFGLSYTQFKWDSFKLRVSAGCTAPDGPSVVLQLNVWNEGTKAGSDVIQVYVVSSTGPRALRAFQRSAVLEPGTSQMLTLELGSRALGASADPALGWQKPIVGSTVTIEVGASATDVRFSEHVLLR
uniref:beta-glucosidase n=1 Tax=Noctiluca scintillans TaxID=2966 RepID=A0A7S1EV75_NOCSC